MYYYISRCVIKATPSIPIKKVVYDNDTISKA